MRRLTSFISPLAAGLAAFVVIALAHAEAHADPLVLTLSDPVQNIPYNGTATFYGTLSNVSSGTINIGTPGHTDPLQRVPYSYEVTRLPPINGGALIRYDPSGLNNPLIPLQLAGMSSTGVIRLFSIDLAPGGTFNGVFTVHYYLPDQPGVLLTASANFTVNASQTPEPATLLLLGSGIAGLAGFVKKQRKSRRG
jgi:hypothetical protein